MVRLDDLDLTGAVQVHPASNTVQRRLDILVKSVCSSHGCEPFDDSEYVT